MPEKEAKTLLHDSESDSEKHLFPTLENINKINHFANTNNFNRFRK